MDKTKILIVDDNKSVTNICRRLLEFAGPFTGYGNLVIVGHGDRSYSLYGHLNSVTVTKGQRIGAQTPLGTSGRNPSGTPALYFELRIDGAPVDPLQWLKRQ